MLIVGIVCFVVGWIFGHDWHRGAVQRASEKVSGKR